MACPPSPISRLKKASTSASLSPPKADNAPGAPTAESSAASPAPWAIASPSNSTPSRPRNRDLAPRLGGRVQTLTHQNWSKPRFLHPLPATKVLPYNKSLMTAASATTHTRDASKSKRRHPEDPEHYRMSIGDHLEELRWRMIFGLMGFVVVAAVCLFYGKRVMSAFCAPMTKTLMERGINPQMVYTEVGEPFMVFI